MLAVVGEWLSSEITAGRIREMPLPLLIHQFAAPLAAYLMVRPAAAEADVIELPGVEAACDIFADAFVRAVGIQPAG